MDSKDVAIIGLGYTACLLPPTCRLAAELPAFRDTQETVALGHAHTDVHQVAWVRVESVRSGR